jgi:hypothetical protein
VDQKSQKEKASRRGQPDTEYDLSACDLAFLEALLDASPSPEMREAIEEEIQMRRRPHPVLGSQRLQGSTRS